MNDDGCAAAVSGWLRACHAVRLSASRHIALLSSVALVLSVVISLVIIPRAAHADTVPARRHPAHRERRRAARPCRSTASSGRRSSSATPSTPPAASPTRARPARRPATRPRSSASNLLAYDITTGNLITTFNHSLNAQGLVDRRLARRLARSTSSATSPPSTAWPTTTSPRSTPPTGALDRRLHAVDAATR